MLDEFEFAEGKPTEESTLSTSSNYWPRLGPWL